MTPTYQLTGVPVDRLVQVRGVQVDRLAQAVAEPGTDLAAVVTRAGTRWATPGEFVVSMLDDLERVAVELVPAWLPDASRITRADLGGVAAIRRMAVARAAQLHYTRSFLIALAVLAVTGYRDDAPDLPVQARAVQLARLVAEGFGRDRCILLVPLPRNPTAAECDAIRAGGDWLAHNAKVAVWLLGDPPFDANRVPSLNLTSLPARQPAPAGRPHPASAVEAALEAALAGQAWAFGRQWNQTYQPRPLTPPVRLDLVWPRERCVVEIDGPEHCHPAHYEADRQRDVRLQLDGFAVLRFTNARVVHDMGAVVHQIGAYLRGRRETARGI